MKGGGGHCTRCPCRWRVAHARDVLVDDAQGLVHHEAANSSLLWRHLAVQRHADAMGGRVQRHPAHNFWRRSGRCNVQRLDALYVDTA
jgi:hypothetical protein